MLVKEVKGSVRVVMVAISVVKLFLYLNAELLMHRFHLEQVFHLTDHLNG